MNPITVPYFSGLGWRESYCNFISETPELKGYAELIKSESMISWNKIGGRPSSAFCLILNRVVSSLEKGEKPEFPNIKFNQEYLAKKNEIFKNGGDATLGGFCAE